MTLSDIVIDFEYAKKLKELGVKQESLFWYDPYQNIEKISSCTIEWTSAFTSDELLKMLPTHVSCSKALHTKEFGCSWVNQIPEKDGKYEQEFFDSKLSNALAKMLIYLIENGYIKVGCGTGYPSNTHVHFRCGDIEDGEVVLCDSCK